MVPATLENKGEGKRKVLPSSGVACCEKGLAAGDSGGDGKDFSDVENHKSEIPSEARDGVGSPRTEVPDDCESPVCLGTKPRSSARAGKLTEHRQPGKESNRWSKSRNQKSKQRAATLFKREIDHAPVGWYFSGYWLKEQKEQKALPQQPYSWCMYLTHSTYLKRKKRVQETVLVSDSQLPFDPDQRIRLFV
ncbi:N-alpha-acetyltransferase 10 [Lemmus lemmus]